MFNRIQEIANRISFLQYNLLEESLKEIGEKLGEFALELRQKTWLDILAEDAICYSIPGIFPKTTEDNFLHLRVPCGLTIEGFAGFYSSCLEFQVYWKGVRLRIGIRRSLKGEPEVSLQGLRTFPDYDQELEFQKVMVTWLNSSPQS